MLRITPWCQTSWVYRNDACFSLSTSGNDVRPCFFCPFWLPRRVGISQHACLVGVWSACCCCSPLRMNMKTKNNCSSRTTSLTIKSVLDVNRSRCLLISGLCLKRRCGRRVTEWHQPQRVSFLPSSLCWHAGQKIEKMKIFNVF